MPKNYHKIIFLLLFSIFTKVQSIPVSDVDGTQGVLVRTVPWGANVVLECLSNDKNHNFQYWHLVNKGLIIGPANNYDVSKFRFHILSGNLTIRAVSEHEEGLYECVSRAVKGENLNIRVVRMLVQHDWEDVYEHDYNINLIRVLIALITLVLISMGAYVLYGMWKERYRFPRYLEQDEEEEDDDDTEEIFSQPSTSTGKPSVKNIVPPAKSKAVREARFDDVDISTDFKSILDTANEK